MYKIEKFLLDHNFKKIKKYISGVIIYSDAEQEYEYETEVAIFTKHDPLVFEVTIRSPYALTLSSNNIYSKRFWKDNTKVYKALAEDHVDYVRQTYEWLINEVKNPWEVVE